MSKPVLIVIDVQNDYFEGGAFPLWNVEQTLAATEEAIANARAKGMPVVFVQHIAQGPSPFFNPGTEGVKLHKRISAVVGESPVIVKQHADAFESTTLDQTLQDMGLANVAHIDGGFSGWKAAGAPVADKTDKPTKG